MRRIAAAGGEARQARRTAEAGVARRQVAWTGAAAVVERRGEAGLVVVGVETVSGTGPFRRARPIAAVARSAAARAVSAVPPHGRRVRVARPALAEAAVDRVGAEAVAAAVGVGAGKGLWCKGSIT